jgi:hypothetical protein
MTKSKFAMVLPELIKQAQRKKSAGQPHITRTRMVEVAEHVIDDTVTFLTPIHMILVAQAVGGTYVSGAQGNSKIVF